MAWNDNVALKCLEYPCPTCLAAPGEVCRPLYSKYGSDHQKRNPRCISQFPHTARWTLAWRKPGDYVSPQTKRAIARMKEVTQVRPNREYIESRIAMLERRLEQTGNVSIRYVEEIEALEKQLSEVVKARQKYGEDDFGDRAIITFDYAFDKHDDANRYCEEHGYAHGGEAHFTKYYSYAFIKVKGKWYGTGPRAPKEYSWDELIDWFERGRLKDGIWLAREVERVI